MNVFHWILRGLPTRNYNPFMWRDEHIQCPNFGDYSCIIFYIFNISYCRSGDSLIYMDFIVNNKKQMNTAAL